MRAWMVSVPVALVASALQGQVVLCAAFEEGRVDRYRLEAEIEQSQEGEGALGSRSIVQDVDLRLTTVGVDPDGLAVVSVVIERASVEWVETDASGAETRLAFEWSEEGEGPEGERSELERAWDPLVGSVLRCVVSADGRVLGVESSSQEVREGGASAAYLGVLAPEAVGRTLERIWGLDPRGRERSPGDAWAVVEEVPISPGRRAVHTCELTLERVENGRAIVAGRVSSASSAPGDASVVELALSGAGSVEAVWLVEPGALESRRERGEMVLDASLGQGGPSVTTRVRRRLALARLGP